MAKQKNIYKKLRKSVTEEIMSFLIREMLSKEEIKSLANRCELRYDGVRTSTVPVDILIEDLAKRFLDDPDSGLNITKYLLKKIDRESLNLSNMTAKQIKKVYSVERIMSEGPERGSSMIISMLIDPRSEINEYAVQLWEKINEILDESEGELENILGRLFEEDDDEMEEDDETEEDEEESEIDEILIELEEQMRGGKLARIIDSFKPPRGIPDDDLMRVRLPIAMATVLLRYGYEEFTRALDRMKEQIEEDRRKEEILQEKTEKLQERLTQQRHLSDEIARERADLRRKVAQLERKLAALSDQQKEVERLRARCHELERENRKMEHDLREMEGISREYEELKIEKAKLEVALKTVGERLERERNEYQDRINELQSHISLLRSQRESLSKELKRLRESRQTQSKPQRSRRDKPRVGVFVDVQNMFYAARENYNGKLDYAKLLDVVVRDRILVTANAYVVYNPEIDQSSFLSFLEYQGYRVKSKNLTVRSDGSAKGNWDVGMTIDIISMIDDLDVVALVSGDGDFCPLVEMLQKNGIAVEVYGFERNTSMELKGLADEFYPISGDMVIID